MKILNPFVFCSLTETNWSSSGSHFPNQGQELTVVPLASESPAHCVSLSLSAKNQDTHPSNLFIWKGV